MEQNSKIIVLLCLILPNIDHCSNANFDPEVASTTVAILNFFDEAN